MTPNHCEQQDFNEFVVLTYYLRLFLLESLVYIMFLILPTKQTIQVAGILYF